MNRNERWLGTIFFIALLLCLLGLWYGLTPAQAQDTQISVCQKNTDAGIAFVFSNIPDTWLGDTGWYSIGDDATLDDHTITVVGLQFDNGYSYAVVGDNTYGENITASTDDAPKCDEKPIVATMTPQAAQKRSNGQVAQIPVPLAPIASTGRTCIVKYPQVVVVCNG